MQDFNGKDYGKCSYCGSPKVLNPKTNKTFCSSKCWLKGTNGQGSTQNAPQVNSEPYRGLQINKENSMRIMSSGRDATLIVAAQMAQGSAWTDEQIKEKISEWNKFFFEKIYVDVPFRGNINLNP